MIYSLITNLISKATMPADSISDKETPLDFIYKDPTAYDPSFNWPEILKLLCGSTIILVLLALTIAYLAFKTRWLEGFMLRLSKMKLRWLFLATWIFGFFVYDIGMCTGQAISLLTNAPMAALHAFGIFLLNSDISEVQDAFRIKPAYMFCFSTAHVFAAVLSTLFLIKHFGFNAIAKLKMQLERKRKGRIDTYIFWGVNEATFHLAKSIKKQYTDVDKYRIIIVRTNIKEEESANERTSLDRLFDFLSLKSSELDKLLDLGCLTTGTYVNISQVNPNEEITDILQSELKLKSLKRIIEDSEGGNLHMLFLSDDEQYNLHAVSLLVNDSTIQAYRRQVSNRQTHKEIVDSKIVQSEEEGACEYNCNIVFHCHARYNSVHRVIEDKLSLKGISVRVVDSSHISVELLKENKAILPINFVNIEPDASVSSAFNSLVVGFSEVGQDSVRFLYEFGAFVKTGSTNNKVERSDFHMHVVDRKMADLAGSFVANAPAMKLSIPFIKNGENPDALITLHQMDCRSVDFYKKIAVWITTLNYIVIATEDDELNISLAVRIFRAATRYRDNLDKFCILVRAHNDDDHHIRRIADHYNRLWNSHIQAIKGGNIFHQKTITTNDYPTKPLYLFGLDKETYTYENIIDDHIEKEAIEFKEQYNASTEGETYSFNERNKAWHRDYRNKMQLEGEYSGYYPTYGALMNLRRTRGQDYANCLHKITKKLLAEAAIKQSKEVSIKWENLSRERMQTSYKCKNGETIPPIIERILDVEAQTEHLRWNASHEILGYKCEGTTDYKDEIRLCHGCLTEWQNLEISKQCYDYNVVDLSLGIIDAKHPQNK